MLTLGGSKLSKINELGDGPVTSEISATRSIFWGGLAILQTKKQKTTWPTVSQSVSFFSKKIYLSFKNCVTNCVSDALPTRFAPPRARCRAQKFRSQKFWVQKFRPTIEPLYRPLINWFTSPFTFPFTAFKPLKAMKQVQKSQKHSANFGRLKIRQK